MDVEKQRKKMLFISAPFLFILGIARIAITLYENNDQLLDLFTGFLTGIVIVLAFAFLVGKNWRKSLPPKKLHKSRSIYKLLLGVSIIVGILLVIVNNAIHTTPPK